MYSIPAFADIRNTYLRDVRNLLPDAATDGDSDVYVRATATSSAVYGLYQYLLWIARQIMPDTADTENLERHAALRGIARKPGTVATGTVTFTGQPEAAIPAGTAVKHVATELLCVTDALAQIGADGTAVVPCRASSAGAVPDYEKEAVLAVSTPSGVQSQALLTLSGGTDVETDAELLARLLEYMRNPPGGGNAYDYKRWAMEVAGVSAAWVYPLRRGIGTVDVAVLSAQGLPTDELVAAVQAHLDEKRPVACPDVRAWAPTPLAVPVTVRVRLSGTTLAVVNIAANNALASYFAGLAPGAQVLRSRIETIISGITGVLDREVVEPAANVQAVVDATHLEWPRLGALTMEPL
jgi:uncharacterized phage protein gp47/JayE